MNRPSTLRIVRLTRHRLRLYDDTVRQALCVLWEASDRVCSKRLKALLPVLLPALERRQRLQLDPAVRSRLTQISAATIDRLLAEARAAGMNARPQRSPAIPKGRPSIPKSMNARAVRPGYGYLHLHSPISGTRAAHLPSSLCLMDVFSGWTELVPLNGCDRPVILLGVSELCQRLPFALHELAISADLAFCAQALESYCHTRGLTLSGSPQRGNLRRVSVASPVGSAGIAGGGTQAGGGAAWEALAQLTVVTSVYVNFFQASFRLAGQHAAEERSGQRRHTLETPCMRLLLSNEVSEHQKAQLNVRATALDPLQLLEEARRMRSHLALLAAGFRPHALPGTEGSAQAEPPLPVVASPASAVEPPSPLRGRHWRTHPDAFEAAWPTVQQWLRVDPNQTGKTVFERLQREFPGVYREGQLRSLQRRVRAWRSRGG